VNISFEAVMKVLLIVVWNSFRNEIAPSDEQKGQSFFRGGSPLISQNIRLSELAPFQRCLMMTFAGRLSRHRRAVPSASLDKSALWGY